MRIAVDGRELQGKMTGIGRFLLNFLEYVAEYDRENMYILLFSARPTHVEVFADNIRYEIIPEQSTLVWDQIQLPRCLKKKKADLFFSPYYKLPFLAPCPTVITIHDVHFFTLPIYRKQNGPLLNAYYRIVGKLYCRKAASILTVSQRSRWDIIGVYEVPPEKVHVVYNGVNRKRYCPMDPIWALEEIKRYFPQIMGHFILYVGNSKPHKNVNSLMKVYKYLPKALQRNYQLVLVGVEDTVGDIAAALGLGDRVVILSRVEEHLLPVTYNAASLFISASLYEGFGLPALEAMACGTPVVVSDRGALPEVVGDAGLLFDPENISQMVEMIQMVLEDESLRREMSLRGLRRASQFSAERIARKILGHLIAVCR